ncbi:MAG: hypothetical protein WBF21_14440, partial [Steroidobacteraceae bacterium]
LTLSAGSDAARSRARQAAPPRVGALPAVIVIRPDEQEMAAHEHILALLDKASGGKTVWRKL